MGRAKRNQLDSKLAQADQEVRPPVTRSYAQVVALSQGSTAKSVDPGNNLAAPGAPLLTNRARRLSAWKPREESKLGVIIRRTNLAVTLDGIDAPSTRE